MDPATVIALCKENIQPLRYGRNATQLGTALRAQEDADAQQLLLQEKVVYEEAIKNYEGDDPLENWYEYILWVEQSYPKSGHESHIGRLLQQCLAIFEKEIKYHQDRRYIRLWINYISIQKNPLELYQLLHNNGIGTMVADMYRAWAFELEQIEDYKRADEVYIMGLTALAEPRHELDSAHKNFQLAVARKTLGHTDDRCEMSLFEQRQAFSSLRAIKAGKKVGSIRTGHRVRDYYPGAIPQVSTAIQNTKSNARISIYQDEIPSELKGASILDHVPVEDIHKENTIKPGPWNHGHKRFPLITSAVRTAFRVHEDQVDDCDMEKLRLFPNHTSYFDGSKYHEHLTVPVYVPDPPNPNIMLIPHYPKEIVYANNADRSMEEIRAQIYLERRGQDLEKTQQMQEVCLQNSELRHPHKNFQNEHHHRHDVTLQELQQQEFAHQKMTHSQRNLDQQREVEELENARRRLQVEQHERQQQQYKVENLERLQRLEAERAEAARIEAEMVEAARIEVERVEAARLEAERVEAARIEAARVEAERVEAERIEAERIEAERIEAQRMEAELNTQRKLHSSNYMHQHHTSSLAADTDEHLLGQSMTVNTKEAMSVVQDLWHSLDGVTANSRFRSPIAPRMMDSRTKSPFDIHMDSSMTQHAMSSTKHSYNMQPYNDQENPQSYPTPHQNFANQEGTYGAHGLQSPYHYQMQQHHDQQVQTVRQHHQLLHPLQHTPHHQALPHLQSHTHLHMQAHNQPEHHPSHHNQSQHQQSHDQSQLHQSHGQPQHNHHIQHQQQHHHTHQHIQQMHHPVYTNILPNDMTYQQFPSSLEPPLLQQNMEPQKQLHFSPYSEPNVEFNKTYRMPPELPYIKSPGMNRRDLKYLENAEDKENAIVVDYNGPLEENMTTKQAAENSPYIDESLGVASLMGANDTCYTDAFNAQLTSSTPMTNHFRLSYRVKDVPQFPTTASQVVPDIPSGDGDDKLSVILESTREYVSSSSGSSAHTRTTGLGFTLTKEEIIHIREESIEQRAEKDYNESQLSENHPYEQRVQVQIQAVHAQSPRTVQRNVDQITSEIKNNCDLRKSISFALNNEPSDLNNQKKADSMDCEEHEPMDHVQEEEPFQLPTGDINPFDKVLIAGLLRNIKFPQPHHAEGYVVININLNKFVPSTMITLGNEAYDLEKCLGKGMYGTVFKAVNLQTGQTVALKTQKPAWIWEYYIAREIKSRLTNPHMLRGFMDVTVAYIANNGSILVSEYSKYGTLLAVTNQIKIATGKPLTEPLALFFTIEMLQIVEHLHKCHIIHGDIKPDNLLLMRLPTEDMRPTIQLIDFGCSIDMSLLPENTTFKQIIKTEDFTCIEMQTGKPWTYQTDLYCLAATSHCLLFGNYMKVSNNNGRWFINSKLPRYAKKAAWEQYFTELLNIESCDKMPDLSKLRNMMEETLAQVAEVQSRIRTFVNILNKR